ncbi:hypothetical protein L195_g011599 [Trifolium pratense]|uniref:Uncharacterized protein n=1 Tax=Trifolium pratense TaxID=57577 RepID=A0A2K3PHZ0_TRIPR|nr:hypothetical protein L195_g011599 [Trifolium pratense]
MVMSLNIGSGQSVDYAHCVGVAESALHLCLFCDFAAEMFFTGSVWLSSFRLITSCSLKVIWKSRNEVIFANGVIDAKAADEAVALVSVATAVAGCFTGASFMWFFCC